MGLYNVQIPSKQVHQLCMYPSSRYFIQLAWCLYICILTLKLYCKYISNSYGQKLQIRPLIYFSPPNVTLQCNFLINIYWLHVKKQTNCKDENRVEMKCMKSIKLTWWHLLCAYVSAEPRAHHLHPVTLLSHLNSQCQMSDTFKQAYITQMSKEKLYVCNSSGVAVYSLVDVLLNIKQVVGHCLEGQLMENRWDGIKTTINNDELGSGLISTLKTMNIMNIIQY